MDDMTYIEVPEDVKQYTEKEIEAYEGKYDEHDFYHLPDGDFFDPEGYYFDVEGYDETGGYYDDEGQYVPAEEEDLLADNKKKTGPTKAGTQLSHIKKMRKPQANKVKEIIVPIVEEKEKTMSQYSCKACNMILFDESMIYGEHTSNFAHAFNKGKQT